MSKALGSYPTSLMGSTAVAYLAVTGLATNLALAGRGVVRPLLALC
jgi:hypothetical protein